MPEQPQWSERTLDMPPQDPWADPPTAQVPPTAPPRLGHGPSPQRPGPQPPGDGRRPGPQPPGDGLQPTASFPGDGRPAADAQPFSRGRAQVNPRPRAQQAAAEHEPTGTGWPGAVPPDERRPMSWHVRELRRGSEWSSAALLFAFVCWGIWAISSDGDLLTPIIVFLLSLVVAAGLFALARVVGRVVLEKQFHRVRRTARGAHIVAAVFLVGLGVAHLRQTTWVMDAYRWVVGVL